MQVNFSDTLPSDARLVAHIADKGAMPDDLEKSLSEGATTARFKGNAGQLFEGFVERDGSVVRVAVAGAGKADANSRTLNLEQAGAALAAKYLTSGETRLVLDLNGSGLDAAGAASVLLGLRLRSWRHDHFRTKLKDEQKISLKTVTVVGAPAGMDAAWADAQAVAEGVEFTRDLVAEPANTLFPVSFVEKCQEKFAGTGAELTVLDDAQMEELGMGSLLCVGRGSEQPSRMLAIRWNGGADGEKPTAFVGKGVTFDTGGISIKPSAGMDEMKYDMCGAASVLGTMAAIAELKPEINVLGMITSAENMPAGHASKPGDVVTSMSGQTIEVLNTDAEGRLILCDALTYTQKFYEPEVCIDVATLTGACVVALGNPATGLFSNDDALAGLAADLVRTGRVCAQTCR